MGPAALGPVGRLRCGFAVGAGAQGPDRSRGPQVHLLATGPGPPSPDGRRVASQGRRSSLAVPEHASAADGDVPGEQCTAALPYRLGNSRAPSPHLLKLEEMASVT